MYIVICHWDNDRTAGHTYSKHKYAVSWEFNGYPDNAKNAVVALKTQSQNTTR